MTASEHDRKKQENAGRNPGTADWFLRNPAISVKHLLAIILPAIVALVWLTSGVVSTDEAAPPAARSSLSAPSPELDASSPLDPRPAAATTSANAGHAPILSSKPSPRPARAASSRAGEDDGDEGLLSSRSDTPPRESETETASHSISGSLLDDAGVPLPGMELTAQPANGDMGFFHRPSSSALRTETDRLGLFEFSALESGEYQVSAVETEAFHPARVTVRSGASGIDVIVQRKAPIRVVGTVLDDRSTPLPGARVESLAGDEWTSTNALGEYTIELQRLKAGSASVLRFSHKGFRSSEHRVTPDRFIDLGGQRAGSAGRTGATGNATDAITLDVELAPLGELGELFGRVTGPLGEPVAQAEVRVLSSATGETRRQTTGPEGTYRFPALEQDVDYRLGVRPSGSAYAPSEAEHVLLNGVRVAHDVMLESSADASLAGQIVDPSGRPLPAFDLWLNPRTVVGRSPIPVRSDPTGRFAPVVVPAGPVSLQSRSQPRLEVRGIELEPGEHREIRVPVDWGRQSLFGQVIDARDRPVRGARVTLQWTERHSGFSTMSQRQTRSDVSGYFSFGNLGADVYDLTCSAPGFRTGRITAVAGADNDLVVILRSDSSEAGP